MLVGILSVHIIHVTAIQRTSIYETSKFITLFAFPIATNVSYEKLCASWYHLYNLKNVKTPIEE